MSGSLGQAGIERLKHIQMRFKGDRLVEVFPIDALPAEALARLGFKPSKINGTPFEDRPFTGAKILARHGHDLNGVEMARGQ